VALKPPWWSARAGRRGARQHTPSGPTARISTLIFSNSSSLQECLGVGDGQWRGRHRVGRFHAAGFRGDRGRRHTHFVPIVREVLLSDRDFLGLLYLREDREEADAGIPDDNPFLAEHARASLHQKVELHIDS